MKLRYTERSAKDLENAFLWYEKQQNGLGYEFLDCVEFALSHILDFPEICGITHSKFRRCNIRRFPFSIFYTIEKEAIIIHSVFDYRLDPRKRPK